MELYYDNEPKNTWNKFILFVKYIFTNIDESKTYIISNGDKFTPNHV